MKKLMMISFLMSAFAVSAGADYQASSETFTCYAKNYENLWFSGTANTFEAAREAAMKSCRQNAQAPETCQVRTCDISN